MDTHERTAGMPMSVKLSPLWVFMMLNMVFADMAAAVLTEIPIAMIVLSRVLKHRTSGWANVVAGMITIAYVAGGSTRYPHGIFFSAVQVACALPKDRVAGGA